MYTLSARGHLDGVRVALSLVRAHICVCMKTWFYVGVCLINCERVWETVCLFIWVRARRERAE